MFRTGVSAFTRGRGKLMVPMVFVYTPTTPIVLAEYFTLISFLQVSVNCAAGVFGIAMFARGYFLSPLGSRWRMGMAVEGLLLVASGFLSGLNALVIAISAMIQQFVRWHADRSSA